jgi:ABC-type dipeptide/oligopeptide/nickel transport system permease component
MLNYILRRLLLVPPTLIGMTLLVFFTMALAPGGTSAELAQSEGMRPGERKAREEYLNKRYGLNQPLVIQYLRWLNKVSPIGFRHWDNQGIGQFAIFKTPDLGESMSKNRPVLELIGEALPITLLLNLISIPIVYGFAIMTGIGAARRRGEVFDIATGTVLLGLWSVPVMLAGVLLQGFLSNREHLHWFPTTNLHDLQAGMMSFLPQRTATGWEAGWLLDTVWHLVLPVVCLSYGSFAFLSKLSRGAMLETIRADFVRTARAKGAEEKTVIYVHVLRNSLLPLITVAATILPSLLAGSVIVETIFSINGMGYLSVEAVMQRDRELVLSNTLVAGVLGLISYLLADIGYAIADPRVSYE